LGNGLYAGVSVVGNGVGTKYDRPIGPPTNSNAGSELMQLMVLPTLAYRLSETNAVGVSLIAAYQRLKITGVEHVGLSNPGFDHSYGYGLGLGWTGKVASSVTLGASYFSKTRMGKLDKYRTLLAGGGEFDIPEHLSVGIAVEVADGVTVGADALRVNWHDVRSVGNSITSPGALGSSNGPGFGWRDQDIYRIGIDYRYSGDLRLRAGYSRGDQIIPQQETTLNYLAPVTPRRHLSLGGTLALAGKTELSLVYSRAFNERVTGTGPGLGVDPRHSQHWLGVAYGWKL
jgi:long-chain fatty acid transport protein